MEHGFFHPERGYWQTTGEPSAEILATYPAGTVEVPLKPGADYEWQDGAWVHVPPDPAEALTAEREGMVCSRFQAKAALHLAGLLPQVEAAIANADPLTQLAWAEAVEYRRHSPAILTLAGVLELTDEQVDDLFRTAMQIAA